MENGETEPSLCGKDARSQPCGVGRVGRGGQIRRATGKTVDSKASAGAHLTKPLPSSSAASLPSCHLP